MSGIVFRIVGICRSLFKRHYLKNEKVFLSFLFHFLKFKYILKILQKNMIVIANVLPILQTVKDLVTPLSKMRRFRTSCDSENVKGSQTLAKSA